jgi:hypothetical protein
MVLLHRIVLVGSGREERSKDIEKLRQRKQKKRKQFLRISALQATKAL